MSTLRAAHDDLPAVSRLAAALGDACDKYADDLPVLRSSMLDTMRHALERGRAEAEALLMQEQKVEKMV